MKIKQSKMPDEIKLSLIGRLDIHSSPEVEGILLKVLEENENIILDFKELEYISSAGLRILLIIQKKAISLKKKIVIKNITDEVREILDMTGFLKILTVK